jgi:hypothetical protein
MTKDPKTQIMMAAAAVMTRPVAAIPSATAALGSPLRRPTAAPTQCGEIALKRYPEQ